MSGDGVDLEIDDVEMERVGGLVSELEASDVAPQTPPAQVWDRIAAAVAADDVVPTSAAARAAPSTGVSTPMVVEYLIDADDIVVATGGAWADFAGENGADELAGLSPDRTLWSYFDRDEIRELWQLVVQRARTTGSEASVPFRCDSPDTRRWFEMTVVPEASGAVRFRSELRFEESRATIPLLDPTLEREAGADAVPVCSWCGRGAHGELWLDVEELLRAARLLESEQMPPVSYGICGPCREAMSAELLVPAEGDSRL